MKEMIIKNIDPKSIVKVVALIYLFLGFISGMFLILGALISRKMSGLIVGMIYVFLFPMAGFIGVFIVSLLFNFAAGKLGCVKIEIEE